MRKVLLTTTALVALGGASAASALDISGNYMFDYIINDNGTANTAGNNNTNMASDLEINFKNFRKTMIFSPSSKNFGSPVPGREGAMKA